MASKLYWWIMITALVIVGLLQIFGDLFFENSNTLMIVKLVLLTIVIIGAIKYYGSRPTDTGDINKRD